MDDFDDYPVTPRNDEELEELTANIRKQLGMLDSDVLTALEMVSRLRDRCGIQIIVRPDIEMGRKEAYAVANPKRIFLSEATFRSIENDEFRGRMTVAHEAIHIFAHPGAPKARAADRKKTPAFIKPYESAERQARVGAAALLMPQHFLRTVRSAHELHTTCRVSLEAAEIRFKQWERKTKGRPELPFVRAHLDYLKSLTPQRNDEAKAAKLRLARSLWEGLKTIEGEDPRTFRMCDQKTYRIAWHEFERMSECGWSIQNDRIVAWIAIRP